MGETQLHHVTVTLYTVQRARPNMTYSEGVCVYMCVIFPIILDVRLVDVPAGVTQEEGHT